MESANPSNCFKPPVIVTWNGNPYFLDEVSGERADSGWSLTPDDGKTHLGLFASRKTLESYLERANKGRSRAKMPPLAGDAVELDVNEYEPPEPEPPPPTPTPATSSRKRAAPAAKDKKDTTTANNRLLLRHAYWVHRNVLKKDSPVTGVEKLDRVGGVHSAMNMLASQNPVSREADGLASVSSGAYLVLSREITRGSGPDAKKSHFVAVRSVKDPAGDQDDAFFAMAPFIIMTDTGEEELFKAIPLLEKYRKKPKAANPNPKKRAKKSVDQIYDEEVAAAAAKDKKGEAEEEGELEDGEEDDPGNNLV